MEPFDLAHVWNIPWDPVGLLYYGDSKPSGKHFKVTIFPNPKTDLMNTYLIRVFGFVGLIHAHWFKDVVAWIGPGYETPLMTAHDPHPLAYLQLKIWE